MCVCFFLCKGWGGGDRRILLLFYSSYFVLSYLLGEGEFVVFDLHQMHQYFVFYHVSVGFCNACFACDKLIVAWLIALTAGET